MTPHSLRYFSGHPGGKWGMQLDQDNPPTNSSNKFHSHETSAKRFGTESTTTHLNLNLWLSFCKLFGLFLVKKKTAAKKEGVPRRRFWQIVRQRGGEINQGLVAVLLAVMKISDNLWKNSAKNTTKLTAPNPKAVLQFRSSCSM